MVQNPSQITPNADGYYFGNLVVYATSTAAFYLIKGDQEVNLCQNDFTLTGTGKNVVLMDGSATVRIAGNFHVNGSQLSLAAAALGTPTVFVGGNLSVLSGILDLNQSKSDQAVSTLNLRGNLFVASGALITSTDNNSKFIFSGTGDGVASAQTVDVFDSSNAGNSYIDFMVNSGAYLKLVNRNFGLGTNSSLVLSSGATLDFSFKDAVALNVVRSTTIGGGETSLQMFDAQAGSTLKISSPEGIIAGSTVYTGNVQVGAAKATRIFSPGANYIYVGKANAQQVASAGVDQLSGNGLPTRFLSGNIVIDLDTKSSGNDDVSFMAQGFHKLMSTGTLKILKGKVIDKAGNGFEDESGENGNFMMIDGRYQTLRSGTQPPCGGIYTLSGGIIEFAGDADLIIRDRSYLNVEVSGSNVSIGAVTKGLEFQPNGKFTVKKNATLKIGNAEGFSGGAKTAINATNNPTIILEDFSTIEYNKTANQTITPFNPLTSDESNVSTGGYYNLKISGNNGNLENGTAKRLSGTNAVYVRNDVEVTTAARLIIEAGQTLTVRNAIANYGGSQTNFIVESDGNLVQLNAAENITPISVRRIHTLSSERKEFMFLSSPVKNQHMKYIFGNTPSNIPYVTVYNEKTDYFVYAKESDYKIPAKGFSIQEPVKTYADNVAESLAYNEAEYKGIPNNGNIDLPLPWTDLNHGYNVAGNPYPSDMDIVALYNNSVSNNNIDPTFYFWDNTVNDIYTQMGSDYSGYSYALFNTAAGPAGYGIAAPGRKEKEGDVAGTKIPSRYVKVSQGFMIRALDANASLKYNNTMRKKSPNNTEFFGKSSATDSFRLEMTSSGGVQLQNGFVYFEAGTNDLGKEDSFLPNTEASDAVFSLVENEKLVINGKGRFTADDKIALGTKHFAAGKYTFKTRHKEGVFTRDQPIYLIDKHLKSVTNLSKEPYEFFSDEGQFLDRFELVYRLEKTLGTGEKEKSGLLIYKDGQEMIARLSTEKIKILEVFDITGRSIYKKEDLTNEIRFNISSLVNGIYIVKVVTGAGKIFSKKIRND